MSKAYAFLAGFGVAAAAAGAAWWSALAPKWKESEDRALLAERFAQRAKRDAAEAQQWAETEQRRRRQLEDENVELKRTLTAEPPKSAPATPRVAPADEGLAPEQWDRKRISFEIETLSKAPARVVGSERYANVVRALKAKGDEGVQIPIDVLRQEFPNEWKIVCATLLGALGDVRGVQPLLALRKTATDAGVRSAALRGLANLPGDEATPVLVAAWNDPTSPPIDKLLAIHGLARRKHETALAVVEGGAPLSTAALRYQAMRSLHAQAMKDGWKDAALAPVFAKGLRSADGDLQREVALLALEGFWSKDTADDLDAFATASSSPAAMADRARKVAAGIRDGRPRPAGAGEPREKPAASPVDAEPLDSDAPMKHGK
jgi:hypothetical protein